MMIKPGITELDRCVDSRYTLVSMVSKRARMIGMERLEKEEKEHEYDKTLDKPVTEAVNEIAGGVVGYIRSEAIERAREYEIEKFAAITQLEKEQAAEKPAEVKPTEEENPDPKDMFGDAAELVNIDKAIEAARALEAENEALGNGEEPASTEADEVENENN